MTNLFELGVIFLLSVIAITLVVEALAWGAMRKRQNLVLDLTIEDYRIRNANLFNAVAKKHQ